MLRNFWNDNNGFLISAELVIVATLLVLGLIVGWVQVQVAVMSELADLACAFGSFNQSYSVPVTSVTKVTSGTDHTITVGGSQFADGKDSCDCFCTGHFDSFLCSAIAGEGTH